MPSGMGRLAAWAIDGSWPPDVPKDAGTLEAIDAALACLAPRMRPVQPRHLAVMLARIRSHYHAPKISEAEAEMVAADWAQIFADMPPDLIGDAIRAHVASPPPASRFAPQPGELLMHISKAWFDRKVTHAGLMRAREMLLAALDTSRQIAGQTKAEQEAANEAGWDRVSALVNRLSGKLSTKPGV